MSFSFVTSSALAPSTGTTLPMLLVDNTNGTQPVHIPGIKIVSAISVSPSANLIVTVKQNVTVGTITQATAATPVASRTSTADTYEANGAKFYFWNGALTGIGGVSSGREVDKDLLSFSRNTVEVAKGMAVAPGQALALYITSLDIAAGTFITVNVS